MTFMIHETSARHVASVVDFSFFVFRLREGGHAQRFYFFSFSAYKDGRHLSRPPDPEFTITRELTESGFDDTRARARQVETNEH